jgi:hypothetical protein
VVGGSGFLAKLWSICWVGHRCMCRFRRTWLGDERLVNLSMSPMSPLNDTGYYGVLLTISIQSL